MSSIVWIRNDLRFLDNPALFEAVCLGQPVVLVYILENEKIGSASRFWLERSLLDFGKRAKKRGFGWVIRKGHPQKVLQALQLETRANHVFWNQKIVGEDFKIQKALETKGIKAHTYAPNLLVEPHIVLNKQGKPYRLFTPFWNVLKTLEFKTLPEAFPKISWKNTLRSSALTLSSKKHEGLNHWLPGEDGAHALLSSFCTKHLKYYQKRRDIPEPCVTSMLSPHLHFGEISVRYIWKKIASKKPSEVFLRQLCWRDFTHAILYHFPHVAHGPFREKHIAWRKNKKELLAWQQGMTGIPIVDAGMRQLLETGWMHNRVRMIVASFLVKHLLHNWKEGEAWFWDNLFDADLANNSFGWQWIADCGPDSNPWYRIFNPVLQGEKFDPQGNYVRKYIPELKETPNKYIHKPWEASKKGEYPDPIVDLQHGRERALASD